MQLRMRPAEVVSRDHPNATTTNFDHRQANAAGDQGGMHSLHAGPCAPSTPPDEDVRRFGGRCQFPTSVATLCGSTYSEVLPLTTL